MAHHASVRPRRVIRAAATTAAARRARGFSLIEIIIVMVIIGVLATMAMPKMAGAAERSRLTAAERQVHAALASAEQRAFRRGQSVRVTFHAPQDEIRFDAGGEHWTLRLGEPPFEISISSVNLDSGHSYEIHPDQRSSVSGTVVLERRGRSRTLTLGPPIAVAATPLDASLSPDFSGQLGKPRLAGADGTEPPPRNGSDGGGTDPGALGTGGGGR